MGRVAGKIALVTGGGSGLGAEDCVVLAREGASVIVTDIDLTAARRVAGGIGTNAIALELDVADEASWLRVMAEVEQRFGHLDILVNNAGVELVLDIEATSIEQFRRVNAIMSEGVFLGCKHGIALIKKSSGGSIINLSSTVALLGYANHVAYAAAKGAVRSMTKSIAIMCQDKGYQIRCNSVHPGTIETPLVQRARGRDGVSEAVPDGILPAGAIGAPSDCAAMVLFLASDESRFVNGAEFVIDNAATIRP